MKRTWMVASNKRAGKARLASEPPHRGDASPDAPPDTSLHSTIHTFRRCLAVCCCFVAATGSPSWAPLLCWLRGHAGPVLPGGASSAGLVAALARSFVVSVGSAWRGVGAVHDVVWHLRYHGAQQPPAFQSPSAASLCLHLLLATSDAALTSLSDQVEPRVVPQRCCHRSARAASACGPLQSATHHTLAVLRSSSCVLSTPVPLHFAQLRTGLCGHSERQWKEMLAMVAGMSGQMDKRKEDCVYEAGNDASWCDGR